MEKVISIGKQNFESLRENHYFFVDKSHFIKDWWENGDEITLITRPRRFGKTLNMSMLDCFFSNKYAARGDLFEASEAGYSSFVKALMQGDLEAMNYYMNKVSLATFSHFDVGGENSESLEPERFYHGFVLGLMAERAECYQIRSNRESGFGRYDVMMIPRNREKDPAIIIEFKVCSRVKKETLEDAVQEALKQIVDKKYDAELVALGVPQERIRHYGFAFAGKRVLIGA